MSEGSGGASAPTSSAGAAGARLRRWLPAVVLVVLSVVGLVAGAVRDGTTGTTDHDVATGEPLGSEDAVDPDTADPDPGGEPEVVDGEASTPSAPGESGDVRDRDDPVRSPGLDPTRAGTEATATLERFLALADAAYADPDASSDLEGTATGLAADEVEAVLVEYRTNGFRQQGAVRLASVTTADLALDENPPVIVLAACVDATEVALHDEDGNVLSGPSSTARNIHHYHVSFVAGGWQVTRHSLPDDPDC